MARTARVRVLCVLLILTVSTISVAQTATQPTSTAPQTTQPGVLGNSGEATPGAGNPGADAGKTQPQNPNDQKPPTQNSNNQQLDDVQRTLKQIQDDMAAANKGGIWDPNLVLGIGSLLLAPGVTDYQNQSNVLSAVHLGKATPQLLTGVSFRTPIPSLFTRFRCYFPAEGSKPTAASSQTPCTRFDEKKNSFAQGTMRGETWERNPWSAFVSLKFAPGASNPINGYVLGGAFSIAAHLDVLVGFALTPVSEPAPGFRTVAAQFVQSEQQQGKYLNFNANAMLHNAADAFDGFPTTNPATGALIYPGSPLTTHYRGGVVIGVSLPIAFSSFLKNGTSAPPHHAYAARDIYVICASDKQYHSQTVIDARRSPPRQLAP